MMAVPCNVRIDEQVALPTRTCWRRDSLAALMILVLFAGAALGLWHTWVALRVRREAQRITAAVKELHDKYSVQPVNGSEPAILKSSVRRAWPRYHRDIHDDLLGLGLDIDKMDGGEALVFWLGGLPSGGPNSKPCGFNQNPVAPFAFGPQMSAPLFEFDPKRLTDDDGDGWLEYRAPSSYGQIFEWASKSVVVTRR